MIGFGLRTLAGAGLSVALALVLGIGAFSLGGAEPAATSAVPGETLERDPMLPRVAIWAALLVVPPVLGIPWIRRGLARESNARNAAIVGLAGAPAALGGWVLTGFGEGWLGMTLAVGALGGSLVVSYIICEWVEALRT